MKHNLLFRPLLPILLLLCAFLPGRAQEANLTVIEGKTWDYFTSRFPTEQMERGFHFKGTETLDGKEYAVFRDGKGDPRAYLRQEGDKVYVSTHDLGLMDWGYGDEPQEMETEYLLYDFSLQVGDRFTTIGFDSGCGIVVEAEVSNTYEIENQGRKYRVQEYVVVSYGPEEWGSIEPDYSRPDAVMIEGVGPDNGYLYEPNTVGLMSHFPTAVYPVAVLNEAGSPLWMTQQQGVIRRMTLENQMVTPYYTWEYAVPGWFGEVTFTMRFDGLYLVEGKYYLNFHTISHTITPRDGGEAEEVTYKDEVMFLLREEDGKVYMCIRDYECFPWMEVPESGTPSTEYLLYDFSLARGESADMITTWGVETMTVKDKQYSNDANKRWTYTYTAPNGMDIVANSAYGNMTCGTLATIDTDYQMGFPYTPSAFYPIPHEHTYLLKVIKPNGEPVWINTEYGAVEAVQAVPSGDGAIYDLHGRRVAELVPGSVYVCDGRKYVAR